MCLSLVEVLCLGNLPRKLVQLGLPWSLSLIALKKACSEVEWLRNLLADLSISIDAPLCISIHCDCQAAIAKSKSKIYNGKSRHIRLRHNIIKQLLESRVVALDYVKSNLNLIDHLTKQLNRRLVINMSRGIGLMPRT